MEEEEEKQNNLSCIDVKAVLVGESGVGKTSILKQFTTHIFDPDCQASISSQFTSKVITIPNESNGIRFDLWDTAGQEKYRSLAKIFYKDAKVVIFVYEVISKKSFENLKSYWYEQVKNNCSSNAVFALVANKSDLYNKAEIEEKDGIKWADEIGAIFQSTSAMNNTGIDSLFENIGKKIINPNFNYKEENEADKKLYELKKQNEKNKKNKKEIDDENDIDNIPDVKKIKIDINTSKKKKKRKCC